MSYCFSFFRQKKEIQEAKKAEEAAKREQIFQEYLRKKEERENAEEDSRAGISPAKKREKNPTKPRPKSQPPSLLDDKYSASSASSQEDIRGGRRIFKGGAICLCAGEYKRR